MKRSTALILTMMSISAMASASFAVFAEETKLETAAAETEMATDAEESAVLEDGIYSAEFDTDSSMFHVNEANEGRGVLTVEDGQMTIHVSLASDGILNLYPGFAEDAQKEGAELLEPTKDTVTYSDGMTEEVNGFDIPVPALDVEFDVALVGKKGKWYDHKVSVSDPQKLEMENLAASGVTPAELGLEDGVYQADVTLTGGTGKSTVESPARVTVSGDAVTASVVWSSPNYDYMIVDGVKYDMVNTEGNSVFEIPVAAFDTELPVIADTVAMSTPHEIEYTLNFVSSTLEKAE